MTLPRHLVSVWNPSYSANAMEEHLAVLLHWAAERAAGRAEDDDVYVWWGKVRSPHRLQKLSHEREIESIDDALSVLAESGGEGRAMEETHLYLTDYRALYVGDLDQIIKGELPENERAHAPAYYAAEGLACDFWFKLFDIRRLVADDLPAVGRELAELRNTRYHDKRLSLYGGMVELPLIVTREDGAQFFDPNDRAVVTDHALWAQFDRETGAGVAAVERSLREDLLGDTAWWGLEPAVRTFVATAEKTFRDHRGDPAFDFAPVLTGFTKALEVQTNAILRRAVPLLRTDERLANLDGRTRPLDEMGALTLGQLARAIGGERSLNDGLRRVLEHGGWFAGQLPAILDGVRDPRNVGSHSARISERETRRLRDQILGVGCEGILVQLAHVRPK